MGGGPLRSDEMTDILQTIGPHRKVHFTVYMPIHIDPTLGDALGISFVSFRQCRYRSGFVTAVMVNRCIWVLRDRIYKSPPYVAFVLVGIRPERMVFRGVSLTHEHANQ